MVGYGDLGVVQVDLLFFIKKIRCHTLLGRQPACYPFTFITLVVKNRRSGLAFCNDLHITFFWGVENSDPKGINLVLRDKTRRTVFLLEYIRLAERSRKILRLNDLEK